MESMFIASVSMSPYEPWLVDSEKLVELLWEFTNSLALTILPSLLLQVFFWLCIVFGCGTLCLLPSIAGQLG